MTKSPHAAAPPTSPWRAAFALCEVVGVFVLGHALAQWLAPRLGVAALGPAFGAALAAAEPDFAALGWLMLQVLAVQYACLVALACGMRRWHRKRGAADFGLTLGSRTLAASAALGVAGFAVSALPLRTLLAAHSLVDLGPEPPMWRLLDKPWTPGFWFFAAIASFVVVAFCEEFFYRGYVQARLQEDWAPGQAILLTAVLFTLTHAQYIHADPLAVGTVVSIFALSVGLGALYGFTGSLIAPVVCHALVNVPVAAGVEFTLGALTVLLVLMIVLRHQVGGLLSWIGEALRQGWKASGWLTLVGALTMATTAVFFALRPAAALVGATAALVVAIAAVAAEKSGARPR